MGGFDVETFRLLVLLGLESMEVESGLTLVVVRPQRTKDVAAKEEQLILFCTKIDVFWLEWMVSELLVERQKHEDCSNSWTVHLSQTFDCLQLVRHIMGVCV